MNRGCQAIVIVRIERRSHDVDRGRRHRWRGVARIQAKDIPEHVAYVSHRSVCLVISDALDRSCAISLEVVPVKVDEVGDALDSAILVAFDRVQERKVTAAVRVDGMDAVAKLILAERGVNFGIDEHAIDEIERLIRWHRVELRGVLKYDRVNVRRVPKKLVPPLFVVHWSDSSVTRRWLVVNAASR